MSLRIWAGQSVSDLCVCVRSPSWIRPLLSAWRRNCTRTKPEWVSCPLEPAGVFRATAPNYILLFDAHSKCKCGFARVEFCSCDPAASVLASVDFVLVCVCRSGSWRRSGPTNGTRHRTSSRFITHYLISFLLIILSLCTSLIVFVKCLCAGGDSRSEERGDRRGVGLWAASPHRHRWRPPQHRHHPVPLKGQESPQLFSFRIFRNLLICLLKAYLPTLLYRQPVLSLLVSGWKKVTFKSSGFRQSLKKINFLMEHFHWTY